MQLQISIKGTKD